MTTELLDRIRRIETKLSRFIAGEPDAPTQLRCEAWSTLEGYEVEVNSMSISLQEIVSAARGAGCAGDEFVVTDNGKPRLSVREIP